MNSGETLGALRHLGAPLRRMSALAWIGGALGLGALVLAAAAGAARLGWFDRPYWVLLAWALVAAAAFTLAITAWQRGAHLPLPRLAHMVEEIGRWRRGSLTSFLDSEAGGTSPALFRAADRAQAGDLRRRGRAAIAPLTARYRVQALAGGGLLALGLLAFTFAGPVDGPAAALWHPGRAWKATVAPVRISSSDAEVDQGGHVKLSMDAYGRAKATLWLRAPGETWKPQPVLLDSLGHAVRTIGPLQATLFARLTSGTRSSDTVEVRVRPPVFLGTLSVSAHYPRYLRMEDEPITVNGDTMILPAGTRLDTRGQATAQLRAAAWQGVSQTLPMAVSGTEFSGSFTPHVSGVYRLEVFTAEGASLAGDTIQLPLRVVADSSPRVEVPVPGVDTIAPLSLRLSMVIDAQDDHGVTSLQVESRRISRLGFADPAKIEQVALPPDAPDRAIVTFDLDLNQRGLLPGDTVRYFVRASDNAPRPNTGRSREFVLRLPTLSEVRAAARQTSEAVGARLDSIAAESRRLERQTDDLARERPRESGSRSGKSEESLSFEAAKQAGAVAEAQQEMIRQAESIAEALQALQKSAEAAGLNDPEWQKRLEEIREQLNRAISPELRERLAELQKALKDLDAARTKEALERLAEVQKELREALERSKELFRRAALEGDLANLTAESKDLARQQEQWTKQVSAADSARLGAEERQLANRADSLSAALDRVGSELAADGRQEKMEQAAQKASRAAQQMKRASQSARSGQRRAAREQGERALQDLLPLSDELAQERQTLQNEWRQEIVAALDQALSETGRLAERQLEVQESFRKADLTGARAEQAAVDEGVQKLLDQLKDAAGKNALVSPQISVALAAAQQQMRKAREAVSSPAPNGREAAEQAAQAVDALNAAAYAMLRNRGDVQGAGSGSGMAEALERMSQLASQQEALNGQTGGLIPLAGNSGAIQQQLQRIAAQQRALAQELEKLRAGGQMPGAGQMADEARELARRLEAGRLDRSTAERQERLFRRMLDAGRTLQGQEEDEKKDRQSTSATGDSIRLPPALRARLESEDARLRMPSWEELQRFTPEERRLVVEYFRLLSDAPPSKQ